MTASSQPCHAAGAKLHRDGDVDDGPSDVSCLCNFRTKKVAAGVTVLLLPAVCVELLRETSASYDQTGE